MLGAAQMDLLILLAPALFRRCRSGYRVCQLTPAQLTLANGVIGRPKILASNAAQWHWQRPPTLRHAVRSAALLYLEAPETPLPCRKRGRLLLNNLRPLPLIYQRQDTGSVFEPPLKYASAFAPRFQDLAETIRSLTAAPCSRVSFLCQCQRKTQRRLGADG